MRTAHHSSPEKDHTEASPLLICTDWFVPGYRAGGPIRSVYNLVGALHGQLPVKVWTRDRDLGDDAPYPSIESNTWQPLEGTRADVWYSAPAQLTPWGVLRQLRAVRPACLYLNSMFSVYFTLLPLFYCWLGWIQAPVVLAPRGMLKPSALHYKSFKKHLFLVLFRWSGMPQRITFQATSEQEQADIQRVFGPKCRVVFLPNLLALPPVQPLHKQKHAVAQFLFLGRIHPIKNLDLAISAFLECPHPAVLNIVGGLEDLEYWGQCQVLIAQCPPHLRVYYVGELPHRKVQASFSEMDFLLLPTQGENFGYAIIECLAAGLPVIISDQTPWQGVRAQQAGWSLPIHKALFVDAIAEAASMSPETYAQWSLSAQQVAQSVSAQEDVLAAYRKCFGL